MTLQRGYAGTGLGQIHYVEAGPSQSPAVLCLHQTPRSVDEFAEVLPALAARGIRGIAMDTLGFGASAAPREHSIEDYAEGVVALLDELGEEQVSILGHHTGGVIAVEVAAAAPDRVTRLVLTSTPYVSPEFRERRRDHRGIDAVEVREDGGHLVELWGRRATFYPPHRPDILTRFVRDALLLHEDQLEAGHRAVGGYRMEDRIDGVRCPVLLVGADADPYAYPHLAELSARLPQAATAVISGGTVALMEVHADDVADLVRSVMT